jgi:hypothetical protein
VESLRETYTVSEPTELRLRAMWALHLTGQLTRDDLQQALQDHDPHVRAWAIQLLCEDLDPPGSAINQFTAMAQSDPSPIVRLYLASAAERLDEAQHGEAKWSILEALSKHGEDADDHNLPQMIWFGLEPLVTSNSQRALALAGGSKIPLLSRHVARRLADAEQFERLLTAIGAARGDTQLNMLLGLRDAVDGRYDMKSPAGWSQLYPKLRAVGGEPARIALQLSQQFGDTVAAEAMLATLQDASASLPDRRQSLQGLAGRRRVELRSQLVELMSDKLLRRDAIRAVAAFDDEDLGKALLQRYAGFSDDDQLEANQTPYRLLLVETRT